MALLGKRRGFKDRGEIQVHLFLMTLFMLACRELETMTKDEHFFKAISSLLQTELIKEMILSQCQVEHMTWMCTDSDEQNAPF